MHDSHYLINTMKFLGCFFCSLSTGLAIKGPNIIQAFSQSQSQELSNSQFPNIFASDYIQCDKGDNLITIDYSPHNVNAANGMIYGMTAELEGFLIEQLNCRAYYNTNSNNKIDGNCYILVDSPDSIDFSKPGFCLLNNGIAIPTRMDKTIGKRIVKSSGVIYNQGRVDSIRNYLQSKSQTHRLVLDVSMIKLGRPPSYQSSPSVHTNIIHAQSNTAVTSIDATPEQMMHDVTHDIEVMKMNKAHDELFGSSDEEKSKAEEMQKLKVSEKDLELPKGETVYGATDVTSSTDQ